MEKFIIIKTEKELLPHHKSYILKKLLEVEYIYQDIISWWNNKVLGELDKGDRVIIILLHNNEEAGLSILKTSREEKKICHIVINQEKRLLGLGTKLMEKSLEILGCKNPVITVNINNLSLISPFLIDKFGFKFMDCQEIKTSKIPEFIFNTPSPSNILMSIKTEYSKKIFSGEKRVELRKRFGMKNVDKVFVYSSGEEKKIVGYFKVDFVKKMDVESAWDTFNDVAYISEEKFKDYYNRSSSSVIIGIKETYKFNLPLNPRLLFGSGFIPPQSYKIL